MYRLCDIQATNPELTDSGFLPEELLCMHTHSGTTPLTNLMQETFNCYMFTLVTEGGLTLNDGTQALTLQPGDLYIFAPGMPAPIVSASADYHGICIVTDEQLLPETSLADSIIRTAYFPTIEYGESCLHLSAEQAERLEKWLRQMMQYQESNHRHKTEILHSLLYLFQLELQDIMEQASQRKLSEHTERIFINFIRLLPRHFVQHHDITFYADELHITTTYLSRIVRQATGRTVVDFINQLLLMEASWLLQSTTLGLAVIAERLHFADQPTFSKFFTRMKQVSPKAYRVASHEK